MDMQRVMENSPISLMMKVLKMDPKLVMEIVWMQVMEMSVRLM